VLLRYAGAAYGIQLVYSNLEYPERVTVRREGEAVLSPAGGMVSSHVSVTRTSQAFLWAIAAHRDVEDRQFGGRKNQPGFARVVRAWQWPETVNIAFKGHLMQNGQATCQVRPEYWLGFVSPS